MINKKIMMVILQPDWIPHSLIAINTLWDLKWFGAFGLGQSGSTILYTGGVYWALKNEHLHTGTYQVYFGHALQWCLVLLALEVILPRTLQHTPAPRPCILVRCKLPGIPICNRQQDLLETNYCLRKCHCQMQGRPLPKIRGTRISVTQRSAPAPSLHDSENLTLWNVFDHIFLNNGPIFKI